MPWLYSALQMRVVFGRLPIAANPSLQSSIRQPRRSMTRTRTGERSAYALTGTSSSVESAAGDRTNELEASLGGIGGPCRDRTYDQEIKSSKVRTQLVLCKRALLVIYNDSILRCWARSLSLNP